jgi:quercetin dioxygenase-like cupin family protein
MNSHPGQEFNYIIEGRMKFNLNGKIMELNEGDSYILIQDFRMV